MDLTSELQKQTADKIIWQNILEEYLKIVWQNTLSY